MSELLARDLTHAIMRHYGYTDEQIEVAEDHLAHEVFGCEFDTNHMRWECADENGNSRHPDHDELARTANLMVDVVVPIVEREIERGQRDLAAKVEALAEEWQRVPNGFGLDGHAYRAAGGLLRALLADALPQEGAEEPPAGAVAAQEAGGGVVGTGEGLTGAQSGAETCRLAFGDGYTCDLPKGHA